MVRTILIRSVLFGLLWLVIADGRIDEPLLVVLIVAASVGSSLWLWSPGRSGLRWMRIIWFAPYFVRQSVLGGWDVARRALAPSLPVTPGFVDLPLRLQSFEARVVLTWIVSLLPGTASVRLTDDRLLVHALDTGSPNEARLTELERRVGRIFGEDVYARDDPAGPSGERGGEGGSGPSAEGARP